MDTSIKNNQARKQRIKAREPVTHEFRTKHLQLHFDEKDLIVEVPGLIVHAAWAQVSFRAIGDETILLIGDNVTAFLTAQDFIFLKPIIESFQRSAIDAAKPETPEPFGFAQDRPRISSD